jgi:dTMP kinase
LDALLNTIYELSAPQSQSLRRWNMLDLLLRSRRSSFVPASHTPCGVYAVVEGVDGTGKTTVARLVAERLRNAGRNVVELREPSNGAYGARVRAGDFASPAELHKLLTLDREHVAAQVASWLATGCDVIQDRNYASFVVYQDAPEAYAYQRSLAVVPHLMFYRSDSPARIVDRLHARDEEKAGSGTLTDFDRATGGEIRVRQTRYEKLWTATPPVALVRYAPFRKHDSQPVVALPTGHDPAVAAAFAAVTIENLRAVISGARRLPSETP